MSQPNVPEYQLVLALRGLITSDYNTTRNNPKKMVHKDWPRTDLTKNSYPRIHFSSVTETGDAVAIGQKASTENTYVIQMDIWIWDKPEDAHFLTVNNNTVSGTRARDEITRNVLYLLRKNFYTDSNLTGYYDYRVRKNRVIFFDEKEGLQRRSVEIEFKEMDTGA